MSDWKVIYYQNIRGERVVRQEIENFGLKNQARIITLIGILAEYGLNLSGHYIKHVGGDLWELRIDRYRIIYTTVSHRRFLMLRAFIKKTERTPNKEIRIAVNRLHVYLERKEG